MKNLETEEDYRRLDLARMREDERCGSERRRDTQRMDAPNVERRRAGDRRKPESAAMLRHRELRNASLQTAHTLDRRVSPGAITWAVVCAVAVLLLFARFTPQSTSHVADCNSPVAPHVNWTNCSRPGLVADGADLTGIWARNVDLTGARLVGSRLAGADLAFSTLNISDLRHADLSNARLTGAGLQKADLRGAVLAAVDFSYADLREAQMANADLTDARFDNAIWIDGTQCAPGSIAACIPVVRQ
jgi:uncharacterized protein YjbI with pentapeptide repeats